jgi:acyl-coenzyme A thioesterase PaaI-like protein
MEYKITKMQNNSSMCIVCGLYNDFGLKTHFFETENHEVICKTNISVMYQSYPDRLHGGMVCTLLDEILGRVNMIDDPEGWAVTATLDTRYIKPVPLNEEILIVAKMTRENRLLYEAEGKIVLSDGSIAAKAHGKYVKSTFNKITDIHNLHNVWFYDNNFEVPSFIII